MFRTGAEHISGNQINYCHRSVWGVYDDFKNPPDLTLSTQMSGTLIQKMAVALARGPFCPPFSLDVMNFRHARPNEESHPRSHQRQRWQISLEGLEARRLATRDAHLEIELLFVCCFGLSCFVK